MYVWRLIDAPSFQERNQMSTVVIFMERIAIVVPECEKPMSMKRWWRWVLSGWKGERCLSIRTDITRRVSNTGMLNTASVNAMSPKFRASSSLTVLPDERQYATKKAIAVPIISVPPSPMNIFDLPPNTLCRKNGISAPTPISASPARVIIPQWKKNAANRRQDTITYPDEHPFTPSMRLMALMIPTPAKIDSGQATYSGMPWIPQSPWKSSMKHPVANIIRKTIIISTMNLNMAEMSLLSSHTPIASITVMAQRFTVVVWKSLKNMPVITTAGNTPMNTATPPNTGTGVL